MRSWGGTLFLIVLLWECSLPTDSIAAPMRQACPKIKGFQCNLQGLCFKGVCYCRPGLIGEACNIVGCVPGCSRHGECKAGKCVCDEGFTGPTCDEAACPGTDCGGHGICQADRRNEGKLTCFCEPGWRGRDCAAPLCPMNSMGVECAAKGQCDLQGKCHCHAGWTGISCTEETCREPCFNGGLCSKDKEGRALALASNRTQGGGNQTTCVCQHGFSGDRCEVKLCPNHCSEKGRCNSNGECICIDGWRGPACNTRRCRVNPKSNLECYDNGVCKDGHCVCLPGWSGAACETLLCPENCHAKEKQGECLSNKCECYPGYAGVDCSVKLSVVSANDNKDAGVVGAGVCGEDCDHKCSKEANCVIHTEQLFTFETFNGSMYRIDVPITRGTGKSFDKLVVAQRGVRGEDMPVIDKSASTDRICFLKCLRGCKRRCFEDLHQLSPQARIDVIAAKHLNVRMPGITGNLVGDLTKALGGNESDGTIAMLSDLKLRSGKQEGGADEETKGENEEDMLAKAIKATVGQVSSAVKEAPVVEASAGSDGAAQLPKPAPAGPLPIAKETSQETTTTTGVPSVINTTTMAPAPPAEPTPPGMTTLCSPEKLHAQVLAKLNVQAQHVCGALLQSVTRQNPCPCFSQIPAVLASPHLKCRLQLTDKLTVFQEWKQCNPPSTTAAQSS